MSVIMQLCGDAYGRRTPFDGQFLKSFDFEAGGGIGEADMTPNRDEAKKFADVREATEFWQRTPVCKPVRDDGRPNRPLSSTTWAFVPDGCESLKSTSDDLAKAFAKRDLLVDELASLDREIAVAGREWCRVRGWPNLRPEQIRNEISAEENRASQSRETRRK